MLRDEKRVIALNSFTSAWAATVVGATAEIAIAAARVKWIETSIKRATGRRMRMYVSSDIAMHVKCG